MGDYWKGREAMQVSLPLTGWWQFRGNLRDILWIQFSNNAGLRFLQNGPVARTAGPRCPGPCSSQNCRLSGARRGAVAEFTG